MGHTQRAGKQQKKKNMSTNITAVIVKLSISTFTNRRQDRAITDHVKLTKALGNGAGAWVKFKLPEESLEPIRKLCGEIRSFHALHTSPWDNGMRLLGAKARPNHDARFADHFSPQFTKLVDEFCAAYPNWIEQARIMHGATFDGADYPEVETLRGMFKIEREYFPVPKPQHFGSELKGLYGLALEALTEKKIGDAMTDAWERLIKPVQAMAEKLSSPDAIFRDSLVDNVRTMVQIIPDLNLTNDAGLKEAASAIQEQLATLNVESLRESKVDRKDAAERAKALVARFGQLGARKFAAAA